MWKTYMYAAQLLRAGWFGSGVGYGTCEVTVKGPNLMRRPGKGGIVAVLYWLMFLEEREYVCGV